MLEFVVLDYVLGDDELLAGVQAVPPGTDLTLSSDGVTAAAYADSSEWLSVDGPTTDASDLLQSLRGILEPMRNRQMQPLVALTAGRDSRAVARALGELEVAATAFTIGGGPDLTGARSVATGLGWEHAALVPNGSADVDWQRAVRACRWNDGLEKAWNNLGPGLESSLADTHAWDVITGSGGEIGRGFYWANRSLDEGPIVAMTADVAPLFEAATVDHLRLRLSAALESLPCRPSDPRALLDLLYAYGRMRKWLGNGRLPVPARSVTAAYTHREVVSRLLRLTWPDKATGASFDQLVPPLPQPPKSGLLSRGLRKLRRVVRRRGSDDLALQLAADRFGPDSLTAEILGPRFVDAATRSDANRGMRRMVWNALTVEALQESISATP